MPTTTFFNLPPPKREKLLQAAVAEFARKPYGEVSVNRIIQGAEIPRGSFYQYFADKTDLFRYVLRCYDAMLEKAIMRSLDQCGGRPLELPLAPEGGAFRRLVWGLLLDIPYGQVTTYGGLAKKAAAKLGRSSMSPQAVGGAVAHNPISILIPCHRVMGSGGSLTGYAGGVEKKQWLLAHEGVLPQKGSALTG